MNARAWMDNLSTAGRMDTPTAPEPQGQPQTMVSETWDGSRWVERALVWDGQKYVDAGRVRGFEFEFWSNISRRTEPVRLVYPTWANGVRSMRHMGITDYKVTPIRCKPDEPPEEADPAQQDCDAEEAQE